MCALIKEKPYKFECNRCFTSQSWCCWPRPGYMSSGLRLSPQQTTGHSFLQLLRCLEDEETEKSRTKMLVFKSQTSPKRLALSATDRLHGGRNGNDVGTKSRAVPKHAMRNDEGVEVMPVRSEFCIPIRSSSYGRYARYQYRYSS